MKQFYLIICIILHFRGVLCDLPTNCTYDDTIGSWMLHLGETTHANDIDCTTFAITNSLQVELAFPNYVIDQYGNVGTWTMIYNQGFAIILNGRRYFAFQLYKTISENVTVSYCHQTFNGWSHDVVKNNVYPPQNWGCYIGMKLVSKETMKINQRTENTKDRNLQQHYRPNEEFIQQINSVQSAWKAGIYEGYANLTVVDVQKRAGGFTRLPRVKPIPASEQVLREASELPPTFDWRDINGTDFVSPVRNQGQCGSCYAFASMAMLEARARVITKNVWKPIFSTQDIVSCSKYSQGCDGGFPYLIAGMYAQDFGVIEEDVYPYTGQQSKCAEPKNVTRSFVADYGYIGGYYGGCNEQLMRIHLVKEGPIAVSIEVYPDLQQYKGGIYHHTDTVDKFNPFEITNHVVVIVGYGVDLDSGEKYWIVKNSWGTGWGEDGYFRIRRGTDEVAIESIAVFANLYLSV